MKKIKRIAIIGAGPSGISAYLQLIKELHTELSSITLFDPLGVANSFSFNTDLISSITNTSVGVTSLYADDKLDYFKWLRDKKPDLEVSSSDFLSRLHFKEYCYDRFLQSQEYASSFGCYTSVERTKIKEISFLDECLILTTQKDKKLVYDAVILATGVRTNVPLGLNENNYNFIANPYPERNFLSRVDSESKILILGSKLSAIDITIAIHNHYPEAEVTMVSRSGELPSVRNSLLIKNNESRFFNSFMFQVSSPLDNVKRKLENDIENCKNHINYWEDDIGQFIEEINEKLPDLPEIRQHEISNKFQYFIKNYVSSFPLFNAERLLDSIKNKKLKIKKRNLSDYLFIKNNRIFAKDKNLTEHFDLVINASGINNSPIDDTMIQSLLKFDVRKNNRDGLKINSKTMKVLSKTNNIPLYVIGGPATGEIAITNYIRSSTVQARKIVDDISITSHSFYQESFINYA